MELNKNSTSKIKMFEESNSDQQNVGNQLIEYLDDESVEIELVEIKNIITLNSINDQTVSIQALKDNSLINDSQNRDFNGISSRIYVVENSSEQISLVSKDDHLIVSSVVVSTQKQSHQQSESKCNENAKQAESSSKSTSSKQLDLDENINLPMPESSNQPQIIDNQSEQISLPPAKEYQFTSSSNAVSNLQSDQNLTTSDQSRSQKTPFKKLNLANMLNMDFGGYQNKFEHAQKSKVAAPFKIVPLVGMDLQPMTLQKSESISSIRPYVEQLKQVEDEFKNQINDRDHDFDDLLPDSIPFATPNKKVTKNLPNYIAVKQNAHNMFLTYLSSSIFHCIAHFACEMSRLATSYFQLQQFGSNYFKQFVIYDTFLNSFTWFTLVHGYKFSSDRKPRLIEQILNGWICSIIMLCFLPLVPRVNGYYIQLIVQILIFPVKKSVQEEIVLCANKQHLLHFSSIVFPQLIKFMMEVNNFLRYQNKQLVTNIPIIVAQTTADVFTVAWFIYLHTGHQFLSFTNKTPKFDFKDTFTEMKRLIKIKFSLKNDFKRIIHMVILGSPFFILFLNARDSEEDFSNLYLFYSSVSIIVKTLSPCMYTHNMVIKNNENDRIKSLQVGFFIGICFTGAIILIFNNNNLNNQFLPNNMKFDESKQFNVLYGIIFGYMIISTQLMYLKIMWMSDIIWQIIYILNQIFTIGIGRMKHEAIQVNKLWVASAMTNQFQYTFLLITVFMTYLIIDHKNKKKVKFNDKRFKGLMDDLAILDK
ncbi:Transmembrane_domain-containing protein [Hexamita inflata]|uniref:Transmembrane_domain-containing protein n=1 Tax=Hexamita inflata TaxID=28002 RepID=A0ABP1I9U7_9EUKA